MRITYSGIAIELVNLIEFKRRPVMDDTQTDYLYTEYSVQCMGLVSSDQVVASLRHENSETIGTSYARTGGSSLSTAGATELGIPANIEHTQHSNSIITDQAIRHWLTVPRRRLLIETDAQDFNNRQLLRSPSGGKVCDARNGPFPEVFSIRWCPTHVARRDRPTIRRVTTRDR